jgi:hypothetical protein
MNMNRFKSYSAEDFVVDEMFCDLVDKGTESIEWLKEQLPGRRYEIDLAVAMLHQLKKTEFQQSERP